MKLTRRTPAAPDMSFADTLPPPDDTAVLRLGLSHADLPDELDQERMARADAEEQVRLLREELVAWKQAAGAEADLYDDLSVRSLPSLAACLTEPFDEPIPDDAIDLHDDDRDMLKWTDWPPVPGDTGGPLPEPLHDTWTPPVSPNWDAWTGSAGD